ncbi:MAG: glucans biosynthesis glucosyltransferase MdoH [Sphingomonadaceae bacterium]
MTMNSDMPPLAKLEMPVRAWSEAPETPVPKPSTSPLDIGWRRAILIGMTLLVGLLGGMEIVRSVSDGGIDWREWLVIALFVPLFTWISFGSLSALIGFLQLMQGNRSCDFPLRDATGKPEGRTAVLMPVYNEDVEAVFGRIRRMGASLGNRADQFDFFILSDSGPENGALEYRAFLKLRSEMVPRLYYRRRAVNHERKPGNVADWVRKHGAAYPYMLVLDADSVVSGDTMVRLAKTMDSNRQVGLIQTIPTVVNGRTLFARWQQFAGRLYGPIASAGLMWWSGSEASFWGHNAILRTAAFAESCGLAPLSGKEPFGGAILSHDMVEAGLLRRNGWAVHMAEADESFEEYPPTLVDHAKRDRRWCQGNLQHVRLFNTPGLHWVNRLQLLMGASAYLTSPLWLFLLIAAIVHHYTTGAGVAPSPWLLGATLIILFAPKILAAIWGLARRDRAEGFGGRSGIVASVMLDIPLSILTAPLMMLTTTMMILDILRGRKSGWAPQRRDVDGIALSEALQHYRWHLGVGAVMALLSIAGGGALGWMMPVAIGLVVSPLVAVSTSRTATGTWLAEGGVFLIPEEAMESRRKLLGERAAAPVVAQPLTGKEYIAMVTGVLRGGVTAAAQRLRYR